MQLRYAMLGTVLLTTACVHSTRPSMAVANGQASTPSVSQVPPHAIAARREQLTPADRITARATILELYRREGGMWLPHAPVLINEDFALIMVILGA